eukprot:6829358-Pyramimonas_sp.AAC.1
MQGAHSRYVIAAARSIIQERVVLVPIESLSAEALQIMDKTLNLCMGGPTPYDRYRRHVVSTLFFGDWSRHDVFRVVDKSGLG